MAADAPKLKREISMTGLMSITVGGIIGSGIFALAATMGSVAGPAAVVALALLGVVVILLALPYAELSAAFPSTGGPYSLPRRALGDFAGFLLGWGYFLYAFIGTAAIIDVFVEYLGTYWPAVTTVNSSGVLSITWLGVLIGLVFLVGYTLLNIAGIKWGSIFAIVTTFAKVIPLVLFGLIGLLLIRVGNFSDFGFSPFGWTGVAFAMSLGFFAFTGFEAASIPAEEVKDPKRSIPRATVFSVLIVTAIYALVAVAFIGGVRWGALSLTPGDWASTSSLLLNNLANAWGLGILATVVVAGALLSTLGAGGDWVLLQGRMPFAMARDNLFFKSLAKVSPRFGTPVYALVFASALTGAILIALPNFPAVALLASITTLVPYGAASLALLVLRRSEPGAERPFRLPLAWVLTPVAFVAATILIYWASWPWTLVGVFLTLVGVPLYFLFTSGTFRHVARLVEMGLVTGVLGILGLVMVYAPWSSATINGGGIYLNGLPALPVLGTALLFIGIPAYFVTLLLRRVTYAESKGVFWIVAYLAGLGVISYVGDQFFIYENFLQPSSGYPVTIEPMGLLNIPWDLIVLVVFGLAMFLWGYFSALRVHAKPTPTAEAPSGPEVPAHPA
ncbi:MAG TPA: APC family permease [Thermoplasmata archaeon]|nr:APC family permease [Thermoplasmata archaeon]